MTDLRREFTRLPKRANNWQRVRTTTRCCSRLYRPTAANYRWLSQASPTPSARPHKTSGRRYRTFPRHDARRRYIDLARKLLGVAPQRGARSACFPPGNTGTFIRSFESRVDRMNYPHLLAPLDLGHVTLRNRVADGLDAHGPRGQAQRLRQAGRLLRRARARRRGPDGHRRHRAEHRGLAEALWRAARPCPGTSARHRKVTDAVHAEGGRICMQILHAGRYAYHPLSVAPSRIKSPITPFTPRALSARGVERTIARLRALRASWRSDAGYDGVEIMGSEGYLINQFLAARTNQRDRRLGRHAARSACALPVEIVRRTREAVGPRLHHHLPAVDARPGRRRPELGRDRAAGQGDRGRRRDDHQHRHRLARGAHPDDRDHGAARGVRLGHAASSRARWRIPLVATNRINMPEVAERILADGDADMVSMARPLLADPQLVNKARAGRADEINTCIACNQACLDHVFENKRATLPGQSARLPRDRAGCSARPPRASASPSSAPGRPGMACAATLAERGHAVTLFERPREIGGQFNIAKRIPGKEEFARDAALLRQRRSS